MQGNVDFDELTEDKIEEGKDVLQSVESDDSIVEAIRDATDFGEEFIDWDTIRRLERDYEGRTVVLNLFRQADNGEREIVDVVGMKLKEESIDILDAKDLKGEFNKSVTDTRIEGHLDIEEGAGRRIIAGKVPPSTIRFQYRDKMDIVAGDESPAQKEAFWNSCMTVFRYFHELRKQIEKEVLMEEK